MQNIDLLNTLLFATTFLALFFIILYIRELKNEKNIRKKIIDNAKKEVEERLYKDELTGLKNRKSLEDSIKGKDSVVAILLDVDAFEDLNELYGFINAEEVLKELSNILKEFEKTHDVVAYRLSGDIFALTNISNIPFENIFILIEELNKTFLNRKIFVDKLNVDIVVSMTMGISIFQEEPILTAAMALKKAKSLNQSYFVYNNELDSKELIIQSLYWREKIKNAVSENKIIPFYQPIVNRKKEVIKYESLMRIRDFDSNNEAIILTPDKFLGISFKTKQYLELSRIIISKSLDNLLKTQKQKSENLSDYDFLEEFVLKYKKLGVKIAIDDFGSGYSNFIRIIRLKPDYLKIDGSLIKNIDKDNNSYEIVKSIIAFSKTLNIKTIAEYVHSEEIFNLLLELDVDEFQGYYFGKPDEDFS